MERFGAETSRRFELYQRFDGVQRCPEELVSQDIDLSFGEYGGKLERKQKVKHISTREEIYHYGLDR
jgi:hypothetical protein